ncbi:LysM peptidoglycan-binding domain-containing protein [Bacillus sp. T33-2]|uniref:LysM peptidoglycan-binding domain-containing protein n=1 Tax=Bacillus sp. T33-2 TaxID=2054168 RepID=UPI000C76B668|nr:LysM peptidoglycan-binding domain-containing protein [Bacillus sp. T33-2]PLR95963.1 peptidoglycan-binding protein [Bacillus sp. T33-2]
MKQKFRSLLMATALCIAAATTVQAEQVVVHKGDTLWDLSQKYGVVVESIKEWNNLSSDLIHPNDILEVSPVKEVLVRQGDTLWNISNIYGVTVDDLKQWNHLAADLIHPGLVLTIYTDLHNDDTAKTETDEDQAADTQAPAASVHNNREGQEVTTEATEAPTETVNTAPAGGDITAEATPAPAESVNTEPEGEDSTAGAAPTPAESVNTSPVDQETTAEAVPTPVEPVTSEPIGEEITVEATAYTAECEGCIGITKTGVDLNENPDAKVIAVDPNVIPLGSKVYVEGYGYATAEDTGGAIKGNRIDVFIPEQGDALVWGRQQVKVTIIN